MKSWESGLAVCEVPQPGVASAHAHDDEPLACAGCYEFACDFHGDHSPVDEDWLCAVCFAAEAERVPASSDHQHTPGEPGQGG